MRAASLVLLAFAVPALAATKSFRFDAPSDLAAWRLEGKASLDTAKHAGEGGASLRLEPGAKATIALSEENCSGKVSMWVFDDGSAPADPKKYGSGPLWGIIEADGSILTVGPVYAPYLSGDKTYAASNLDPQKNERPWWHVQYLALRRKPGWHKWTFDFDPKAGLRILYDEADINARRKVFNWDKTGFEGITGIVILGDKSQAAQTLWVDDVEVSLGPAPSVKPIWPPPPPKDLVVVPPQKPWLAAPYARWKNGPGKDESYFPIAVWLQDPKNAPRFKAAGFNLYVGLWKGPTEEQLEALRKAGMPVICAQNEVGLRHRDDPIIVGWMHGDEPDNAQRRPDGKGYGPPIPPAKIIAAYQRIRQADPTRPVLLNLGQGVAWDGWRGRGVRTNHPEDYPEYVKGCDIASFDIYPVVHRSDVVRGNLWYVARGVTRLRRWTRDEKVVWNCIECTRIGNVNVKPTPEQVRSEVWMSLIHGSRGLIYFVHQFKPKFIEAALLADPEMLEAVTRLNRQIHELAPVLNSPTLADAVKVISSNRVTPVHAMVKRHGGATYLFAVAMYKEPTKATFELRGVGQARGEVLDEARTIEVRAGRFTDTFAAYQVHIYRIE